MLFTKIGLLGTPKRNYEKPLAMPQDFKLSRSPPSPLSLCIGASDGIEIKLRNPKDERHHKNYIKACTLFLYKLRWVRFISSLQCPPCSWAVLMTILPLAFLISV